jgi:hypothetical protein
MHVLLACCTLLLRRKILRTAKNLRAFRSCVLCPISTAVCLFAQIAGASEFSLDVATTVLRCFQLQPATANKELIAKTLLRCAARQRSTSQNA